MPRDMVFGEIILVLACIALVAAFMTFGWVGLLVGALFMLAVLLDSL